MKEHEEVEQHKKLPKVGQTVRSKKYGTLWRVMEKREVWQNIDENHLIAGIYLCFWRIKEGVLPGVGRLMGYVYTEHDNTFEANWEIV
ncbi:MAG TPA: hypothetical protein VEJ88_08765 [Dissulfurispiraceae bacterium]|nr:hypothetical protein [Dissulfurispiraceae bacterium]